jgi:hypothetical protein
MLSRKKYVGTEKIFPDCFTPRRFPQPTMAMKRTAMGTASERRPETAEVTAAAAAATETATVRT